MLELLQLTSCLALQVCVWTPIEYERANTDKKHRNCILNKDKKTIVFFFEKKKIKQELFVSLIYEPPR